MRRIKIQSQQSEKRKYVTKSTVGWIFLGVLVAIQIFFAIQISTFGGELSVVESESNEIARINQGLKTEVITKLSLTDAEEKAVSMGFEKPKKVVFVKRDEGATALR
jgi:hypothetical protein